MDRQIDFSELPHFGSEQLKLIQIEIKVDETLRNLSPTRGQISFDRFAYNGSIRLRFYWLKDREN